MSEEEILKRIDALAEKLGVASEHVWGVLVKQAVLEGAIGLSLWVIATVGLSLTARFVTKELLEMAKYKEDRLFGTVVPAVFVFILVGIPGITLLSTWIGKIANPEYYAFQEILSVFK